MDDDLIWVLDRSESGAFVPLLAAGRTFTFRSWRLWSPKTVHRGRTTAVPAVLVYLTLKLSNPSFQMSVFSTEFGDDTPEIIDDCEKSRDILDGVLGKRSILNSCYGIGDISSHYILFGCHYKKIFWLGLNSYEQSKEKIKKLQRSLARKKRFSKNGMKVKAKLEKVYNHITNQRRDFLHKLSRYYVDTYATICVEGLDIKGLKEKDNSTGLHRSIHDVSWGRFHSYLAYKAESAGTNVITVDPRNTTQICSNCGSIVKKTLSDRIHECPYCGFVADRDYNAAVNINRMGMEQPFEPVEILSLHHIGVMQVLSMKQEAPPASAG